MNLAINASNHARVIERWRLIATLITIILLGFTSGHWLVVVTLSSAIYVGWQLTQLFRLEAWLREGAKRGKVPQTSGVFEAITTYILQKDKKSKLRKKRIASMVKNYRKGVAALPDATVVLNGNFEINWVNQHAQQLLGIDPVRDMGYRITNIIREPMLRQYLCSSDLSQPIEFISPMNEDVIISLRVVRYGENQHLLIARNISESVRIRDTMKSFVSNASHELRTPLTVTSGYIDIIKEDPSLPDHLREPIEQMREQTDYMTHLINDLLVLSRLESGELEHNEGEIVNVPQKLYSLILDLKQSKTADQHDFNLSIDERLGLRGIEQELTGVIVNLIENAIKHAPAGTIVNIKWFLGEDNRPCLTVEDNGDGFDPEYIPLITNRFFRIKDLKNGELVVGTGLGLAIVKHAIILHGGSLDIRAEPSKGAAFTACFPAHRREQVSFAVRQ